LRIGRNSNATAWRQQVTRGVIVKDPFLVIRLFGAFGGLFGGALAGVLVLILAMILTGSTFGLHNILVGAVIGAHIGALLGFYSPRLEKKLFEMLSNL
jgi:predicted lipid-binding transport protein (Tim44 family)